MIDITAIRRDFPMLQNKKMQSHDLIYLDNGATTFKPKQVIDALTHYYTDLSCNAHRGDYELAYRLDQEFEAARASAAQFIHADEREIIFTSGASEGLNTVAQGYGRKFLRPGDVVLSSEAEHASCILPWMRVCEETGASLEYIPLDEQGRIGADTVAGMMNENVKVIVLAHISNVLGYEAPIRDICRIAHQYGAVVVVDGAQSVPHMPIDVVDLDCDFLAFSAHKMCGPTGIGVLYGKYALLDAMDPLYLGGGSNARFDMCGNILLKQPPYKFESGTANIAGILGMKAAFDYLSNIGMETIHAYEQTLHKSLVDRLRTMDNIHLYNPNADAAIVTFNVKDVFAQDAATYFSANGVAVRSGQHCAKLLCDKLNTSATVRASLYFYNDMKEIERFAQLCEGADMQTCLDVYF
ncbi:aminotransferase class V-fold PLP-dependent enzyme [bacterium c-19]|nr:aminotransferase class V-fold PLP-dependent enzyme [bacterium c-19]